MMDRSQPQLTFGYSTKKSPKGRLESFSRGDSDGSIEIYQSGEGLSGNNVHSIDLDSIPYNDFELIMTYRALAVQQEIDEAIQNIVDEAVIYDDVEQTVQINLDDTQWSDAIKKKIIAEFDYVLRLLDFTNSGYGLFRRWYVDSRLYFHKVLGENPKDGIKMLVPIDPINIQPIKRFKTKQSKNMEVNRTTLYDLAQTETAFIYSQTPFINYNRKAGSMYQLTTNGIGIEINSKAIAYVTSGLLSADSSTVIGHLFKAIKPYNDLKHMENSLVIYRITRAPERRVFYVDIGNLPKGRAEQYMKDIMGKFGNKTQYDPTTGTISTKKKYQTLVEDYWLPRREGSRGTDVQTLPGGQNLGDIEDVNYFQGKLLRALNIPLSRFKQEGTSFNLGRSTEVTRDEVNFKKFIDRLQTRFSGLFMDIMKTQVVQKNIMSEVDWDAQSSFIRFAWLKDNYFEELKEIEVMNSRIEAITTMQSAQVIGTYFSHATVRKTLLRQSQEAIDEEDKLIDEEKKSGRYPTSDELAQAAQDNPSSQYQDESPPEDQPNQEDQTDKTDQV